MLIFKKIVREEIFDEFFADMQEDNGLKFSSNGIAVVYAPNGTGKSSFAHVLGRGAESEYEVFWDEERLTSKDEIDNFHVINDQNSRNIIEGTTEDFVLGDDIKREYFLKSEVEARFNSLFEGLSSKLKNEFGVDKKTTPLLDRVSGLKPKKYIADIANRQSRGSGINGREFIDYVDSMDEVEVPEFSENELSFVIEDLNLKDSVIDKIYAILNDSSVVDSRLVTLEKNSDAITLLDKYKHLDECVVCDSGINAASLLDKKINNKNAVIGEIDSSTKRIFEEMEGRLVKGDPLKIREYVIESASSGSLDPIGELVTKIQDLVGLLKIKVNNLFASCLNGDALPGLFQEYESLIKVKPELADEDILFIRDFVNDCIEKNIELERDSKGNLRLLLGGEQFLEKERSKLALSNGEQNFISIAFELLKAQKSDANFVVLDDPISSFDSIFKNKIIYAISKFLQSKYQILLTHSTDLVKLLEHQIKNSFNFYILNNVAGERNGFVSVNSTEKDFILYLHCLVDFFRNDVRYYIKNEWAFLVSLIPFMRTFARVVNKPWIVDDMTKVMHGYNSDTVADLVEAYKELFGGEFIQSRFCVSVEEILLIDVSDKEILDRSEFPVLNRALLHVLNYLWLRLKVEKELVSMFSINTKRFDQLSSIIVKAFGGSELADVKKRVFLLSRKTLLNDFNHFEQDLSVFQPALDITDSSLKKEKEDILDFLRNL